MALSLLSFILPLALAHSQFVRQVYAQPTILLLILMKGEGESEREGVKSQRIAVLFLMLCAVLNEASCFALFLRVNGEPSVQ